MKQKSFHRGPGMPSSAVPALIGYAFLAIPGPFFYAFYVGMYYVLKNQTTSHDWLADLFYSGFAWIVIVLGSVIYPAVRLGRIWAVRLLRYSAVAALLLYGLALAEAAAFYIFGPRQFRDLAVIAFWFPLAELAVAAWLLVQGLRRQPWFNPNATLEEIGPSRGTIGDFNKQAGLDESGHLSPELAAQALAAPPAPPRWLCYVLPPLAAARMRRWWFFAIATLLCLAAIVMLIVIPIRAIFVYGLMGSFADRLRVLQRIQLDAAREEKAAANVPKTTSRKRKTHVQES